MENKKTIVDVLWARASENLQRVIKVVSPYRRNRPTKKDIATRIEGRGITVPAYSLDVFLSRIILDNECITIPCKKQKNGYVYMSIAGKRVLAHRFSYEFFVGKIKPEMVVDHTCRNRACVNPQHLRQVSIKDNVLCGIGITAINSSKLFCKNGHAFTQKNTYIWNGGRHCRACRTFKRKDHYLNTGK